MSPDPLSAAELRVLALELRSWPSWAKVMRRAADALEALSAERERLQSAIRDAQSEDGVNEDDAPRHLTGDDESAAWVDGFEAGQESVQQHLDGLLPNANARVPHD